MEYKMGEDGTAGVPSSLYSYLFPYLPSLWRWHYWLTLQCFINKLYKFFCIFFCFEGICTISFPFIEKISDFYTTTSNVIKSFAPPISCFLDTTMGIFICCHCGTHYGPCGTSKNTAESRTFSHASCFSIGCPTAHRIRMDFQGETSALDTILCRNRTPFRTLDPAFGD